MRVHNLPVDLITGNEIIDAQHSTLLETVDEILYCLDVSGQFEDVKRLLDFLLTYSNSHFDQEEEVMRQNGYPGLDQHRSEHHLFRLRIETLNMSRNITNHNQDVLSITVKEAKRWIVKHVMSTDVRMAQYLKAKAPL